MTIDEAIKINLSQLPNAMPNNPPHRLDALKLGIEVFKLYIELKSMGVIAKDYLLPGETE